MRLSVYLPMQLIEIFNLTSTYKISETTAAVLNTDQIPASFLRRMIAVPTELDAVL